MLETVLANTDKKIKDVGYESFTLAQDIESMSYDYEDIINAETEVKIQFLKEQFGSQFTDEQYHLIMRFGDEMYSRGLGEGYLNGWGEAEAGEDW